MVGGRLAVGRSVLKYNIHETNMKWNENKTAAKWTENENNNKIIYIVNYLKMVLRLNLKIKKNLYCKIFALFLSRSRYLWVLAVWRKVFRCVHLCLTKKFLNCVHPAYTSQLLNCSIHKLLINIFHIRNKTIISLRQYPHRSKRNARKLLLSKTINTFGFTMIYIFNFQFNNS